MKPYLFAGLLGLTSIFSGSAQVVLNETFAYPDGNLVGAPGSPWTVHSAGAIPLVVTNQALIVRQPDNSGGREDAGSLYPGGAVIPDANGNPADNFLYSSFTVRFTALPNDTGGSYFAHYKSATANDFSGRVGASLTNAAPGTFRLGIGNDVWNGGIPNYPQNLSLGVSYNVVTRYNVDTGASTLWVDPVNESSASVTATDSPSLNGANAYAFRQGITGTGGPGEMVIDNLLVGRTFTDVVPVPEPGTISLITITAAFFGWRLRRRRS